MIRASDEDLKEFVRRLGEDDAFREELTKNPHEVLRKCNLLVDPAEVPASNLSLPTKEDAKANAEELAQRLKDCVAMMAFIFRPRHW